MPHELDTNKSFMSAREPAWHRLGIVKDTWFTAEEALTEAMLGYHVDKFPVFAQVKGEDGKVAMVLDPDHEATVRRHPETGEWQVLGIVTPDYKTFQNVQAFRFMDEVVGNIGGSHYETAGALRGGRQLFLSVSTESADIILDPKGRNDRIKTYILCYTSHDGSLALSAVVTPTRVVCANTLAMAITTAEGKRSLGRWTTRHIGDIGGRAQQAKDVLGIYHSHTEILATQARKMIQTKMTNSTFTRVIEDLFIVETSSITEKDRETMGKVRGLYELSPTNTNITGTVWGGLQSVIEFADWQAVEHRGSGKAEINEMRFRSQLGMDFARRDSFSGPDFKEKAWGRFMAEAK